MGAEWEAQRSLTAGAGLVGRHEKHDGMLKRKENDKEPHEYSRKSVIHLRASLIPAPGCPPASPMPPSARML